MYFKAGRDGKVIQGSYYSKDRKIVLNFDWGHEHYNNPKKGGDGRRFKKGVVHVQLYTTDKNGNVVRKNYNARMMNNEEMKKFGKIIRTYNPSAKFR